MFGDRFLNRVFTKKEIEYCEKKGKIKYQHYAARFAAKEAIFKAISNELKAEGDIWVNIEIMNDKSGKPKVKFLNMDIQNLEICDISMSHCKEYATANAIAMFN